ncbi:(2Fe-2S)-binding protein, partial [Candidatus Albibeggiatoa sp. nov. NOAA]|nr:(2Fe-2S)-binding protein [Thiotrichaceae bacterium]
MYICICQGVTDKQIHNAVCNGACSMRELRECLGVVKQCGKCGRST